MTDGCDRAVIALDPEERNRMTIQAADQPVRVERVRGIEPPLRAWEARVLPLNYTRGDVQAAMVSGSPAPAQSRLAAGGGRLC
jgi:hypothetical protein